MATAQQAPSTCAARAVAAMDPDERRVEYVELAERSPTSTAPTGRRDIRPVVAAPVFSDAAVWAPFVYVGR